MSLPDGSNSRTGSRGEPAQLVPREPKAPQRSMAQIFPSGPTAMPAVEPHFLPPGNWPQLTPARYGLGRSLRAPSGDTAGGCGACGAFEDALGGGEEVNTAVRRKAEIRRQKAEKRGPSRGGEKVFTFFLVSGVPIASSTI